MKCPYCGDHHPDQASFCPKTGKTLDQPDVCRNCGAGLPSEVSFCPVCGTSINNADSHIVDSKVGQALKKPRVQLAIIMCAIFAIGLFAIILNSFHLKTPIQQTSNENTNIPTSTYVFLQNNSMPLPSSTPSDTPPETSTPETLAIKTDLKTNSKDGAEIVFISSGQFLMGSDQNKDPFFWGAESPEHIVLLNSYWIYRAEVTQGMYQKCVIDKSCPSPEVINNPVAQQYGNSRFSNYPVVMVSWQNAQAYCQWAGARLPTEAEWEKAARGTDGRLFPWGNDSNADGRANFSSSSPSPIGSFPNGVSPYGIYDMAGNVLEWVNDYFGSAYYQYSPSDNPTGPDSGSRRVIRGGAYTQDEFAGLRTVARASLIPNDTKISVGFRCAMDEP